MWSGPRNISTAMMRSFGNRADCIVVDEPFYAAYLSQSGVVHPMQEEVLASQTTDWREVATELCRPAPADRPIHYEKHMTHHMLPDFGRDWIAACTNVFLIRHPSRVLASYYRKRNNVGLMDIGFVQQIEIYELARRLSDIPPPVVDADDLLADPEGVLKALCETVAIPFDAAMLSWPPGARTTDGVWGAHWYDSVNRSTEFQKPSVPTVLTDPELLEIESQASPLYEQMKKRAIRPA